MFEMSPVLTPDARNSLRLKSPGERISTPVHVTAYAETAGIGMGCLSDGSVYLTQRGLAKLCGVQNAHIGTISRDWATDKPRIRAIRARLGQNVPAHRELVWAGRRQYGYTPAVCQAILDYYALDAGDHIQPEARSNRLRVQDRGMDDFIRSAFEPQRPAPLRFVPLKKPLADDYPAMDAVIAYVCGLLALSAWMANSYLEGLKQRAMNAPWNRLGLYLPLKAILEIQAEAIWLASRAWR